MRSNYKKLGEYIRPVDERNRDLAITNLQGVSITKEFVPSIANIIGTDLSTYKIVRKGQFAYGPVTSRNGDKVSIALLRGDDCIISSSYSPFEVYKPDELLPEYLMLWFMRPEFDRYARFMSNGSAREVFDWECMCGVELPVPPISEQRKIVRDYQVITNRIKLLRRINEKLEAQAHTLFSSWFVNFDPFDHDVDDEGNPLPPEDWEYGTLEDCIDFYNGYAFKSEDLSDYPTKNSFAVFKMGNIVKGGGINHEGTKSWISKELCNSLSRFILKNGDILMSMTDMKEKVALLGHTALMDIDDVYIVNQRVGLLRPNGYLGISPAQIYLLTNNALFLSELRRHAHVGVQVNLSKDDIVSRRIIYAPENVNRNFARITEPIFNTISNNLSEISVLNAMSTQLLIHLSRRSVM